MAEPIQVEKERIRNMAHPRNQRWFELWRQEIYDFVQELSALMRVGKRNILTKAPVKSGKKEIVENISMTFLGDYKVFYITALSRKDVHRQKVELAEYGVMTCLVNSDVASTDTINQINHWIRSGKKVIICDDECDYGSGHRQKMSHVFKEFLNNQSVVNVYFSATPEETEASDLADRDDYESMVFTPPPEYCGAKHFLDTDLVNKPMPFFEIEKDTGNISVTAHGLQVVSIRTTLQKNIAVVRLSGGKGLNTTTLKIEAVRRTLEWQLNTTSLDGKTWAIKIIDSDDGFDWEDHPTRRGYVGDPERNYLFVIAQTCTRGTDLKGWHPYISIWHDARNKSKCNINTLVQAFLRPCHYSSMEGYDGPQNIHLYADIDVILYVAGVISLDDYKARGGKAPTRTKWQSTKSAFEYDVKPFNTFDEATAYVLNPEKPYTRGEQTPPSIDEFEINAEGFHFLKEYGMGVRVDGKVWTLAEAVKNAKGQYNRNYHYKFVPCYENINDPLTLRWLITRQVGVTLRENITPLITKGSMY